ncbi:MAG: alpha/beta fold hydrolase [Sandaracinaceae bacterium]
MEYDRQGFAEGPDGTRLFWGVSGEGPAVVLNDGIGCDGFAWKYLQPHLALNHQVIHWHYRAHGRSGLPVDAARIDLAAHARDLLAVMDAVGVDEALLVGHSMGTQVSLETYRLAPERVRGLVLVCGSYGKVTATFRGSDMLKQVLPALLETVERRKGIARALWGRIPARLAFRIAKMSKEVDALAIREEDFRPYMEHVAAMEPQIFLAMLRHAGEHTAEDILDQIQTPTLVVAAERDTFTPPMLARHMADVIPQAELLELQGASHAAPIEQPVAIQLRVDRFLRERVEGDGTADAADAQAEPDALAAG